MLLLVTGLTEIIVNFKAEKVCENLYHVPNILLTCWGERNIVHKDDCTATFKKGETESLYFVEE